MEQTGEYFDDHVHGIQFTVRYIILVPSNIISVTAQEANENCSTQHIYGSYFYTEKEIILLLSNQKKIFLTSQR